MVKYGNTYFTDVNILIKGKKNFGPKKYDFLEMREGSRKTEDRSRKTEDGRESESWKVGKLKVGRLRVGRLRVG